MSLEENVRRAIKGRKMTIMQVAEESGELYARVSQELKFKYLRVSVKQEGARNYYVYDGDQPAGDVPPSQCRPIYDKKTGKRKQWKDPWKLGRRPFIITATPMARENDMTKEDYAKEIGAIKAGERVNFNAYGTIRTREF